MIKIKLEGNSKYFKLKEDNEVLSEIFLAVMGWNAWAPSLAIKIVWGSFIPGNYLLFKDDGNNCTYYVKVGESSDGANIKYNGDFDIFVQKFLKILPRFLSERGITDLLDEVSEDQIKNYAKKLYNQQMKFSEFLPDNFMKTRTEVRKYLDSWIRENSDYTIRTVYKSDESFEKKLKNEFISYCKKNY